MNVSQLRQKLMMQMIYLCVILPGFTSAWAAAPLKLDNPPALRDIAFRRYLENKPDTALDFYQKAIEKSVREYGANASYTSELYLEASTVALSMSKFTLAENYLSKAVTINPNSIVARMRLAEVLKLREKPQAELGQIEAAISRHGQTAEARGKLVAWLQRNNPAQASKQAFLINRVNNPPSASHSLSEPIKKTEPLASITPINVTSIPAVKAPNKTESKDKKNKTKAKNNTQTSKTKNEEPSQRVKKSKTAQPHVINKSAKKSKGKGDFGLIPPPPVPAIPLLAPESGLSAEQQSLPKAETTMHKTKEKKDKRDKKEISGKTANKEAKPTKASPDSEPPSAKEAKVAPPNTSDPEADSNFLIDWGGVKKKK
jgi:tetratricopeptide (TPR) repeat protein